ncbi:limb region 1-like protein-like, partial [Scleropages formosus]
IFALFFFSLYIFSYLVITHYRKNAEFVTDDNEDAIVNRIALWLCTFSLSVSIGAILLLPLSILSNEVLLSFPDSYYMQWLNGSLVHGLWNLVFLFSNLSLVFLLPFAYLFTESEGFVGSKKGVMARVYETAVVLLLLSLLVLGMVWVASALVHHSTAQESLNDLWEYYVPYLYSCISLFGMLLLLLCTPFGQSRMFSVTGNVLVKPRLLENVEDTMNCAIFEEASLSRKLTSGTSCWVDLNLDVLKKQFLSIQARRMSLDMRRKASPWQRNVGYPLVMLLLLALTVVCMLTVSFHVLELLFDETAMPRGMEVRDMRICQRLNIQCTCHADVLTRIPSLELHHSQCLAPLEQLCRLSSFSKYSMYLMVSSVVGFYSSPLFTSLLPRAQDTNLTEVDSALPVFSRILGITRFDLLGDFGRYNWLGNFYIVFLYNMLFAGLTSACLIKTVTWAVQRELICAFGKHLSYALKRTDLLAMHQHGLLCCA